MQSKTFFKWLFLSVCVLIIPGNLVAQDLDSHPALDAILSADDPAALQAFIEISPDSLLHQNLLHQSVAAGAVHITEDLLAHGADVNAFDAQGQTPLLVAVNAGHISLTSLLLEHGADPDRKEEGGLEGTPLMYATSQTGTELMDVLLKHGSQVDVVDMNGDPALNWASYYGHVNQMRRLIEHGVDLSLESKHGDAVDVVLRLWHADSVAAVFRDTNLAHDLDDKTEMFFQAVQQRDEETVDTLLRNGVDPNATDALGIPMLHLAVQYGQFDMVLRMLQAEADPNLLNRVGQSPLVNAVLFDHADILDLLLAHGADPNRTGSEYRLTPLMAAAVTNNIPLAKKLLAAGVRLDDIDVVNEVTALHWAQFYGNVDFALFMLAQGADASMLVLNGEYTALSLAEAYGQAALVEALRPAMDSSVELQGSWSLEELYWVQPDTTYSIVPTQPGRLIVSGDTYTIMYSPLTEARKSFVSLSDPTTEEMAAAFAGMVFNSGHFRKTSDGIETTADMARVPGFEGGRQVYRYRIEADHLYLTMYDETYPDGSKPAWAGELEVQFVFLRE